MLQSSGVIPAISANAVVFKSDTLISEDILELLREAVAPLENVPENEKDWHPWSRKQVLDLVHPSLFPLIYGKTRLLTNDVVSLQDAVLHCGKGTIIPAPSSNHCVERTFDNEIRSGMYSRQFQWLPCEVGLQKDGSVKIMSYINNLRFGKNWSLYKAIELIVSKSIPVWDLGLTEVFKNENLKKEPRMEKRHGFYPPRIRVSGKPVWKVDERIVPKGEDPKTYDPDYIQIGHNWKHEGLLQPEPCEETYSVRRNLLVDTRPVDLRNEFKSLQIIVKLANIHLTPERPNYDGGRWHIEGQLNEHICASALLYYDNDNVTDSYLAFRERVDVDSFVWGSKGNYDRGYKQWEFDHMEQLFGV